MSLGQSRHPNHPSNGTQSLSCVWALHLGLCATSSQYYNGQKNHRTSPYQTNPNLYFLNSAVSVFVYNPHFIGLRIISCKHLDRTLATVPLQWLKAKTSIWQETAQERHPLHFFPIARYPLKMCSAHSKDSLFSQITGVLRCMSQQTTARHFNVPCACSLVVLGK